MPTPTTPVEPNFNPVLDLRKPNREPLPGPYQPDDETLRKMGQKKTPENQQNEPPENQQRSPETLAKLPLENQQKQAFLQGYRNFFHGRGKLA